MSEENAFIYSIVGKGKHSARVDHSIRLLQSLTNTEIYVVAGKHRNNITANAQKIEVDIPEELDDHAASIWLKTSLNKHLPIGKTYAYLDSDVLPLHDPDTIFSQFKSPVSLARDHATIDQFSPYAVSCGCLRDKVDQQLELQQHIDKYAHYSESNLPHKVLSEKQQKLQRLLSDHKIFNKWLRFIKFNLAKRKYRLDEEFYFDKANKIWYDANDEIILYHEPNKHIQRNSPYTHDNASNHWFNTQQEDIHNVHCSHFRELLLTEYGITANKKELLWNGGVFMFNESSDSFMNIWHQNVGDIFSDHRWQTRDQAALFITSKILNIDSSENNLDEKWNWLISEDAQLEQLMNEKVKPHFIHLMHPMIDDRARVDDLYQKLRALE